MNDIRLKILFLASWYPSRLHPVSGIFIKRHAEAVSRFCDVAVLYVTKDQNLKDKIYDLDVTEENSVKTVRVYYKPIPKVPLLSKLLNLYRYIKGNYLGLKIIKEHFGKPDVAHVNVILPAGIVALLLKYVRGIPYIITEHWSGYLPKENLYKGVLRKFLTKLIVKSSGGITVVSSRLKAAMLSHKLYSDYYVIPNAIETKDFTTLSNRMGRRRRIAHISLLDRQKNVSGILEALNSILCEKAREDWEFHILGDGIDRERLENLARNFGLYNQHVFFEGVKSPEEVYKFLSDIDFLITNSYYETFSVATAEAIACGVPVIATRCGGPEDFVTREVGILIEPGNQKQLEEAILYMLDHCDKYDRRKLQEYAKSKFSYEVVGRQIYDIYKRVSIRWEVGLCGHRVFIDSEWKVIDVGSGHYPNRRANVLLERYLDETPHRSGEKAKIPEDKIVVVGDATNMPFGQVFDYAICSHVAEHIENIEYLLNGIQQLAKRGYIETPGPVSEFLLNEPYHLWIVKRSRDTLIFRKKKKFKPFSETFYAIFYLNQNRHGHKTIYTDNKLLRITQRCLHRLWRYIPYTYTRYEWDGAIKFKVYRDD